VFSRGHHGRLVLRVDTQLTIFLGEQVRLLSGLWDHEAFYDSPDAYEYNFTRMDAHSGWITNVVELWLFTRLLDGIPIVSDVLNSINIDYIKYRDSYNNNEENDTIFSDNLGMKKSLFRYEFESGQRAWVVVGNMPGAQSAFVMFDDGMVVFVWRIERRERRKTGARTSQHRLEARKSVGRNTPLCKAGAGHQIRSTRCCVSYCDFFLLKRKTALGCKSKADMKIMEKNALKPLPPMNRAFAPTNGPKR
jgi:hypothetical protein